MNVCMESEALGKGCDFDFECRYGCQNVPNCGCKVKCINHICRCPRSTTSNNNFLNRGPPKLSAEIL
ncbi:hypothetical protein HKD37_11G031875 [Glycine soja]